MFLNSDIKSLAMFRNSDIKSLAMFRNSDIASSTTPYGSSRTQESQSQMKISPHVTAGLSAVAMSAMSVIAAQQISKPPPQIVRSIAPKPVTPSWRAYPALTQAQASLFGHLLDVSRPLQMAISTNDGANGKVIDVEPVALKMVDIVCIDPMCRDLASSIANAIDHPRVMLKGANPTPGPTVIFDVSFTALPPGITIVARAPLAETLAHDLFEASDETLPVAAVSDPRQREGLVVIAFGRRH
jgi:hypothetical protein